MRIKKLPCYPISKHCLWKLQNIILKKKNVLDTHHILDIVLGARYIVVNIRHSTYPPVTYRSTGYLKW